MGKHLLPEAHIAKLTELTESEVSELTSSTVDGTAFAILKGQGSGGATIETIAEVIHIRQLDLIYIYTIDSQQCSKLAAKDFLTAKFHQDTWNHNLMLGFVLAHIPRNAISNLALRQS